MFKRKPPSRLYRLKRQLYLRTHPNQARLDSLGVQVYHIMLATGGLFVLLLLLRLIYLRIKKCPRLFPRRDWGEMLNQVRAEITQGGRIVRDEDESNYLLGPPEGRY